MKRFLLLIFSLGWCVSAFSQEETDESKYFYKVSQKPFSELSKNDVAFVHKGVEYRIKRSSLMKKRLDKDKLRVVEPGEVQDIMSGTPATARLFAAGATISSASSTVTGLVGAIVGASMMKNALHDFYDEFLAQLPESNAQYALNYTPEPFVKLTNEKASTIGWDRPAFTYDGATYFTKKKYIYKKSPAFAGFIYKKRGIRPLGVYEAADLMGLKYGKQYIRGYRMIMIGCTAALWCTPAMIPLMACGRHKMKKSLNGFYENMESLSDGVNATRNVSVPTQPVTQLEEQKKEEEKPTVEEQPVVIEVQNDTISHSKEEQKLVTQTEKEVKPQKVKEPKPEREHLEKLNVRKPNGYGLFFDAGGFVFDGPRLGLEMRFNRCMPLLFVGCPQLGMMFKKKLDYESSLKSISAGLGCKGLIPASWGGFFLGGFVQYERYSFDQKTTSVYASKCLNNDISIMAGLGFRLQTKCNLFFNLGGYAGPNFSNHTLRYSNILNDNYSTNYHSDGKETGLKIMGEVSIGFEF